MTTFDVLVSETAVKQLSRLDDKTQVRMKQRLLALKENPFTPRPGADIKKLKGFENPALYRLRVGEFRVIYAIQGRQIKVTEVMRRGKGYAWLD